MCLVLDRLAWAGRNGSSPPFGSDSSSKEFGNILKGNCLFWESGCCLAESKSEDTAFIQIHVTAESSESYRDDPPDVALYGDRQDEVNAINFLI